MKNKLVDYFFDKYGFLSILNKNKKFEDKFKKFITEVISLKAENYVDHIFSSITFISSDEYSEILYDFAEFLLDEYSETNTLLCATAADNDKDSSQYILYDITTAIAFISDRKYETCTRYDKAAETIKNLQAKKVFIDRIIFVDEFFGSGDTASGRVRTFIRHLQDKKMAIIKDINFFVVASHVRSFSLMKNNIYVKNYYTVKVLNNVISKIEDDLEKNSYYYLNFIWCRLFSQAYKEKDLPDLGYGNCEASYYREKGSCPNNVLPIMWWPHTCDGLWREPIFPRYI